MESVEQFLTGDSRKELASDNGEGLDHKKRLNQEVSTKMIGKYIDKLKARGELAPNPDAKK